LTARALAIKPHLAAAAPTAPKTRRIYAPPRG
jgi:hypothetical protein